MKIQAKDVKIGMNVTSGKTKINVEDVIIGCLKNGRTTITLVGSAVYKSSDRPAYYIDRYELVLREDTFVNI